MQPTSEQIARLESYFDRLHDALADLLGINHELTDQALKGALYAKALYCDLIQEGDGQEE